MDESDEGVIFLRDFTRWSVGQKISSTSCRVPWGALAISLYFPNINMVRSCPWCRGDEEDPERVIAIATLLGDDAQP